MALLGTTVALLLCPGLGDTSAALKDEVHGLPGAAVLPSRQFSGFLDGGGGDRLHYWFVESEGDPSSDPVVLWLNGGPGSSSLMGFLTEFGPYIINAVGGIHYNPYTWTKKASVIFLEAPAGVGFSYCGNVSASCYANDDTTAEGSLMALGDFFDRFPKLHGLGFAIWGESYAGVFVSTLSQSIANSKRPLPVEFLGFAVGDPCVADMYQGIDVHPDQAMRAGLIDETLHSTLSQDRCQEPPSYVDNPPPAGRQRCKAAWRLFDIATSGLSPTMPGGGGDFKFLDGFDTGSYIGSMDPYSEAATAFLNRADVQKALHVDIGLVFRMSAQNLRYETQYIACKDMSNNNSAHQYNSSVLPIFYELVASGHSVLLYSGDEDPSVHWRGSERAVRAIGLPEVAGGGWRPWFYTELPVPLELLAVKAPEWGPQLSASPRRNNDPVLGGYVVDFEAPSGSNGSLTFATIRDAGHMIPQFRPHAARHLFDRTVYAASQRRAPLLSPGLPMAAVENSSDQAFYVGVGGSSALARRWVAEAKSYASADVAWVQTSRLSAKQPGLTRREVSTGLIITGIMALAAVGCAALRRHRQGVAPRFQERLL